jgi:hypothetical protein
MKESAVYAVVIGFTHAREVAIGLKKIYAAGVPLNSR